LNEAGPGRKTSFTGLPLETILQFSLRGWALNELVSITQDRHNVGIRQIEENASHLACLVPIH
jgi:hypothetical protein